MSQSEGAGFGFDLFELTGTSTSTGPVTNTDTGKSFTTIQAADQTTETRTLETPSS